MRITNFSLPTIDVLEISLLLHFSIYLHSGSEAELWLYGNGELSGNDSGSQRLSVDVFFVVALRKKGYDFEQNREIDFQIDFRIKFS